MGLNEDTPFVIGANDGVLSNLGVNSVGKGESLSLSVHLVRFEQ